MHNKLRICCFHESWFCSKSKHFKSPPSLQKKFKIHTKDKHIFLTSKWLPNLLHTGICCSSSMVLNYVIESVFDLLYFLVLEMLLKWKWSSFSKKGPYFWIICIKSSLIFYREKNWSFLKVVDHHILEELINLKLKCSF